MRFYNKIKKYPKLIISTIFFGLFLPIHFAFAIPGVDQALNWLGNTITSISVLVIHLWIYITLFGWITNIFLHFATWFMTQTIQYFVVDLGGPNGWLNMSAITAGWTAIRNLSNIIFIFMLLYIAVETILSLADHKKQLAIILVAAVLVNFSMAFTKVAIDASNIITLAAYTKANTYTGGKSIPDYLLDQLDGGVKLTDIYNKDTSPTTYDAGAEDSLKTEIASSTRSLFKMPYIPILSTAIDWIISNLVDVVVGPVITVFNLFINFLLNSVVRLMLIFLFFFIGFVFIYRFVYLVFAIILSPAAFASLAVPAMKRKIWSKWTDLLTEQLLIAPLLMIFLYLVVSIVADPTFQKNTGSSVTAGIIIKSILIIGLLIGAIKVAKEIASKTSDFASGFTKSTVGGGLGVMGVAGRNTLGRIAERVSNSKLGAKLTTMQEARGSGFLGRPLASLTRGVGNIGLGLNATKNSSFDARNAKSFKPISEAFHEYGEMDIKSDLLKKQKGIVGLKKEKADIESKELQEKIKGDITQVNKYGTSTQQQKLLSSLKTAAETNEVTKKALREYKKEEIKKMREKGQVSGDEKLYDVLTSLDRRFKQNDNTVNIAEQIGKLNARQISDIPDEYITKPEVSIHLDIGQLQSYAKNATDVNKDLVRKNIESAARDMLKSDIGNRVRPVPEDMKNQENQIFKKADWMSGPKGTQAYGKGDLFNEDENV